MLPGNERIHHNGEDYVPAFWLQSGLDVIDRCCGELETAEQRIASLTAALQRSDAMLSLLRFRAERTIPWGDVGYPDRREVDQVIGQSRAALGEGAG